ncbi:MAG: hypothetical protein ABSB15_19985 [Bryobacteraceae bacterium]
MKLLLARGADPAMKDQSGDSAKDWARREALPPGLALLSVESGAPQPKPQPAPAHADIKSALEPTTGLIETIALIEESSAEFFKTSGCVSCHAQSMTDWVGRSACQRNARR